MTTDTQAREWGRRALAAGFPWAPGCLDGAFGVRVTRVSGPEDVPLWYEGTTHTGQDYEGSFDPLWPDFRDPATLGVLVAWVRGLWGDPFMWSAPVVDGHTVRAWGVHRSPLRAFLFSDVHVAETEPEAWIAAAEAKGAQ